MTGMSKSGVGVVSKLVLEHGSKIVIENLVYVELESAVAVRSIEYVA